MPIHHCSPPSATTSYLPIHRSNPYQPMFPSVTMASQYPTAYRLRSDAFQPAFALPPPLIRHDPHLDSGPGYPFSTPISLDLPQQLFPLLKHHQVERSLLSGGWKVSGYNFIKKRLTSLSPPPPPSSPTRDIPASPFYVNSLQRDDPLNQRWEHIQSTATQLAPMLDFSTAEILLRTALQSPASSASFATCPEPASSWWAHVQSFFELSLKRWQ